VQPLTLFKEIQMKDAILRFVRDERGATAIEYGIIAGLMAVVLIAIFGDTGSIAGALKATFTFISGKLPSGAAGT
jgi:pilus assembly protein Flp/PilA